MNDSSISSDRQAASRQASACAIVERAAEHALTLFRDKDALNIEVKGLQDWVSNADKSVEDLIRAALQEHFPGDGIIGEEHDDIPSVSGYTWVIDPIDGTTNFVNGTPGWCVVLACVNAQRIEHAVVCDPVAGETFAARRGSGATLNGKRISVNTTVTAFDQGTLGVGHSTRVPAHTSATLITRLLHNNGLFRRSGSGALDLAYVAAGRLIGYVEPHMNAWDCLASLLIIEEAGGQIKPYDMEPMLAGGGMVVTGSPGVFEKILRMAEECYRSSV